MSRIARVVVPGLPHHVTQRGNGRQATYLSDEDRLVYLDLLRGHGRQYGLRIWAYCLMNNHIHLLAVPVGEDSLAHTLGRTHSDYARYWNARRRSCGHVWQARFYSCPLEDDQIWTVARYVEMNPVRAGLVKEAERWPWSSAQAHLVERDASGLLELSFWASQYDGTRWSRVLRSGVEDEAWQQRLVESTLSGRPLGSEAFIDRLEQQLGASLRPKPPGRPPKPRAEAFAASG
jgi:putative transposase